MNYNYNGTLVTSIGQLETLMEADGLTEEQKQFIRNDFNGVPNEVVEQDLGNAYCAVDLDNIDIGISTEGVTLIAAPRVIIDKAQRWDAENFCYVIPVDGVYLFDYGILIDTIADVARLRLSLWLNEEDEWWVLHELNTPKPREHLTGACTIPVAAGDRFSLRLTVIGTAASPAVNISGNDDFTAFSWTFLTTEA